MAERKGHKRALILISSEEEEEQSQEESEPESESESNSEEEKSQEESETQSESEEEEDDEHDQYDSVEEISDSISCDDDVNDDESESDDQKESFDDSVCNRIISLLREGSDLQEELNLNECKAYLRKHGLRLSGTKAECINRINEHWRIKDGNGEALYPISSFTINCTGDVCKGDVVVFSQKVYQKFDKVTRRGSPLGKRKIAGRIVKESYGAAKQQHTFTVEVLWSKGIKKLPPLFPLLVKGRNLYKLKTYRQRWKNEAERSRVLSEKHKRGAAARLVRSMKKTKNTFCTNPGAKGRNHFLHKPSRMKGTTKLNKGKCVDRRGKAPVRNVKSNVRHQKPHQVGQVKFKQNTGVRVSSYTRHQNFTHPNEVRYPTFQSNSHAPQKFRHFHGEFHHQRAPSGFPPFDQGSTSAMMRLPHFRPYTNSSPMTFSEHQGFNRGTYPHHDYLHPTHESEPRNFDRFPRLINTYRPHHPFPPRTEMYEERRHGF